MSGPQILELLALFLALSLLTESHSATAGETQWPQFRGPQGQGTAQADCPREWDDEQGIVWKTELPGLGHSSPVHLNGLIWMTTADRKGASLRALAVDPQSGKLIHDILIFEPRNVEPIHHDNSYASPTPVLSEARLYVHFGTYGTACLDTETGEIFWTNTEFPVSHEGGPGSSPILFDDLLIVTLDGADRQVIVGLDAQSGAPRWQKERSAPQNSWKSGRRAFATPLVATVDGRPQLISPAADQCHAYDPRTGEEIWHVRYKGFSNVPRPVALGRQCFICTGFYDAELWAIDMTGTGNVTDSHVNWTYTGPVPDTPSPVIVGQRIYTIANNGVLAGLNVETGKREVLMRIGGNFSASPLSANGALYLCDEEGQVKVLDVELEKPKVIATNQLDARIMASPAVIEDDLLIRTETTLYRIGRPRHE